MSDAVTYVTMSDIPFHDAFLMADRFIFLNMYPKGIWYVDTQHPEFERIKQTAYNVAKFFGDNEQMEKCK